MAMIFATKIGVLPEILFKKPYFPHFYSLGFFIVTGWKQYGVLAKVCHGLSLLIIK